MRRQFGKYVVQDDVADVLGKGAFGLVYRALNPDTKTEVAIKVLQPEQDARQLQLFKAEAERAAGLSHKNIVAVYDFDQQDGRPYLVMELAEGETLQKVIDTHKALTLLEKIDLLYQVAEGLQYAHSKGVLHRDIKPGNIMVLPDKSAKIMDFGIARALTRDESIGSMKSDVVGTFAYMAPEQLNGKASAKSDIFSYGLVCFQLLTGEHPFAADTDIGMAMRAASEEAPLLRERLPDCPPLLERWLQGMLTTDIEMRTGRLHDVLRALDLARSVLRAERAKALLDEARSLLESNDHGGALTCLDEALQLNPGNREANDLWLELKDVDRRRQLTERVAALKKEATELLAARNFHEAISQLEKAAKFSGTDGAVLTLLQQAKTAAAGVRQAALLLAEAHSYLNRGEYDPAWHSLGRALELDAGNPQAIQLQGEIAQQMRERRIQAALVQAETLRQQSRLDEAERVLDDLDSDPPASPKSADLRRRIEHDRRAEELRRRKAIFQDAIGAARELLFAGNLDAALAAADALSRDFPEEESGEDFRSEVQQAIAARQRIVAVAEISQTARRTIGHLEFDEAIQMLDEGLERYPDDPALNRLRDTAVTGAAARKRYFAIRAVHAEAVKRYEAGELDEAIRVLDSSQAEYGDETLLVSYKQHLENERYVRDYAAGLERILADANEKLAGNHPEAAVAGLESAFQYANEPRLKELLETARRAVLEVRERDFVTGVVEKMAALEEREHFSEAQGVLGAALQQYPHNPGLRSAGDRVSQAMRQAERRKVVKAYVVRIETEIREGDWTNAGRILDAASHEFPGDQLLSRFDEVIRQGQHQRELKTLSSRVKAAFAKDDLAEAEWWLTTTRETCGAEPVWQALWEELRTRGRYRAALLAAGEATRRTDWPEAKAIVEPWLTGAPDDRAQRLYQEVVGQMEAQSRREQRITEHRQAAARLGERGDWKGAVTLLRALASEFELPEVLGDLAKADSERQRQEAEKAALGERELRIAAEIRQALALGENGNWEGSVQALERLAADHPSRADMEAALQNARRTFEKQQQERVARERRDRLAAGRREVASFVQQLHWKEAEELLKKLITEYPENPELTQELNGLLAEWRRQWEAAEKQRRIAEDIGLRRRKAQELGEKGDWMGAVGVLAELTFQYPDSTEARDDFQAAQVRRKEQELEEAKQRGRREAIVRGLQGAAALGQRGDWAAAVKYLEQLGQEKGDDPRIASDLEGAQEQLEKQAHEKREQAILVGRRAAQDMVGRRDFAAACASLEKLATQYPESDGIRQDLAEVQRDWERAKAAAAEEQARQERERQIVGGRQCAKALGDKGDWPAALQELDRLSAEFPHDQRIAGDRSRAAAEWQKQQLEAEQIAQVRAEAADLGTRGDWAGAVEVLGKLSQRLLANMEPGEAQLLSKAGDVGIDLQNALSQLNRQIKEGRDAAAALKNNGDSAGAVSLLEKLAGQCRNPEEVLFDLEAANKGLASRRAKELQREREKRIAGQREAAAELERRGKWAEALAVLDKLVAEFPNDSAIWQDQNRARQAWQKAKDEETQKAAEQERQSRLKEGRISASALAKKEDWAGAIALLEKLVAEHPDNQHVRNELDTAKGKLAEQRATADRQALERQIAERRAEASLLAKQGKWQGALELLERLLWEFPENSEIRRERDNAQQEWAEIKAAAAREREIAERRKRVDALLNRRDWETAATLLEKFMADYPDVADFRQSHERARQELNRQHQEEKARRIAEIEGERRAALEIGERGNWTEAVAKLTRLAGNYPNADLQPDLTHAREKAQEGVQREQRDRKVSEGRRAAAKQGAKRDWGAAVAAYELLAQSYPEYPEIVADLENAKRHLAAQTVQPTPAETPATETAGSPSWLQSRWKLVAAISGGALLLLIASVVWMQRGGSQAPVKTAPIQAPTGTDRSKPVTPQHPPRVDREPNPVPPEPLPKAALTVDPDEVDFNCFTPGDCGHRILKISGAQNFTVSSKTVNGKGGWLRVSQNGPTTVKISFSSIGLENNKDYKGDVFVLRADGDPTTVPVTVHVTLHVKIPKVQI